MKRIISLVLVLVMVVLAATACAPAQATVTTGTSKGETTAASSEQTSTSASTTAEEELHLVFVTPLFAHPVWLVAKDGFDAAAKDLNFRGDWVGPTDISADEMIRQIETAIAEKADGIITQGINPEAMVPVLEKAKKAGIPLVVVNSDIPDAPRLAYLGTDPTNFGKVGGEALLKKMGNSPIKVAYMTAVLDYKIALDMIAGYEEVLKTAPGGYTKLTVAEDKADMLTSVQQFENIFNTYPDCNLVVCVTGSGGPAAAKVVQEKGLKEKVTIMAIDDVQETVDGIKNGVIYATMTQNFFRKGYQAAEWLCDYIRTGEKPPQLLNDSGTIVVTIDNLDTYNADMKKPDTWK